MFKTNFCELSGISVCVPDQYIDGDGWILNEAALVAAIEYKYPDAEVKYITNMNLKSNISFIYNLRYFNGIC